MLKYIELKTGYSGNGPAWIARVTASKSGRTVYFNGRALKRMKGGGVAGNYIDVTTGEEFWISGIKKNAKDRHWTGSARISIQENVVHKYLSIIRAAKVDLSKYVIFEPVTTDIAKFREAENRKLK
jgi:hypothetical protein